MAQDPVVDAADALGRELALRGQQDVAELADEGGLRSALVNTFHELGGAAGVAVLSSAAGAGLVTAHLGSHDFARAFTVAAACAVASLAIAVALVPAVRSQPRGR
jgi:sugar phosphate permease